MSKRKEKQEKAWPKQSPQGGKEVLQRPSLPPASLPYLAEPFEHPPHCTPPPAPVVAPTILCLKPGCQLGFGDSSPKGGVGSLKPSIVETLASSMNPPLPSCPPAKLESSWLLGVGGLTPSRKLDPLQPSTSLSLATRAGALKSLWQHGKTCEPLSELGKETTKSRTETQALAPTLHSFAVWLQVNHLLSLGLNLVEGWSPKACRGTDWPRSLESLCLQHPFRRMSYYSVLGDQGACWLWIPHHLTTCPLKQ